MPLFDQLAASEAESAARTRELAPDFVDFLEKAVATFNESVIGIENGMTLFTGFYIHAKKMASLALLSGMRRHRVQMDLNLRQLIESTTHFAYFALHPAYPGVWGQENANTEELSRSSEAIKKTVNKWIADTYPDFSSDLKSYKDALNRTTAHASILATGWMLDFNGGSYRDQLSDSSTTNDIKVGLYTAGQIVTVCSMLISRLDGEVSGLVVREDLVQMNDSLMVLAELRRAEFAKILGVD